MSTTSEKIAVMQAFEDGKIIERRVRAPGTAWDRVHPAANPDWNFLFCDYRIKPEPREWWAVLFADGNAYSIFDSESEARRRTIAGMPVVRLREVIEP